MMIAALSPVSNCSLMEVVPRSNDYQQDLNFGTSVTNSRKCHR